MGILKIQVFVYFLRHEGQYDKNAGVIAQAE